MYLLTKQYTFVFHIPVTKVYNYPIDKHCCSYMLMINNVISHFDKKDRIFQKKNLMCVLQAICACLQICNWSTWYPKIPPSC